MPVKFWQTIVRFCIVPIYLITTIIWSPKMSNCEKYDRWYNFKTYKVLIGKFNWQNWSEKVWTERKKHQIENYWFGSVVYSRVKGQLISKANCQAVNASKKWTNEFVFTVIIR